MLSDFDYVLPPHLIAQQPLARREDARLLLLDRADGRMRHLRFHQVLEVIEPGDLLVLNDTRVLPARLYGMRSTGGRVEALLVSQEADGCWHALLHARGRLQPGEAIHFGRGHIRSTLERRHAEGGWYLHFDDAADELDRKLQTLGHMPLPPYIKRRGEDDPRWSVDRERYQTVYAREPGAIAAPTAGLHFTESLLEEGRQRGVRTVCVTLHVGLGTFKPVTAEDPTRHPMHAECYEVSEAAAQAVNAVREHGRRVIAVGTTACRALETCARNGRAEPGRGTTRLFMYPPYTFQVVDALLTNFHLPRSTLLMLVSAFAGRDRILHAYETAVREGYRFYSYGDAMLIF
ncbi:MAG: tRNA preQ1(34) S-adenosylmethionine ribosyltransferase-isomerase QueA [Planctomycetes bacterium]|nr:tRNA preQ1(34) S-adenosylmethionine ribosyltransferase-isomerase QueA [Planctomycetota bacterium]